MTDREKRAREIQEEIAEILLYEWDPIGVRDVPEASDEYDSYVGRIYRLLVSGASEEEIAEELARIESGWGVGSAERPKQLLGVAEKLRKLDVKL